MSQQFRIDSETLRDKLNSLLPSQARGSIGVDLSGQTTIVPIVDLTETAEGSTLRQDLQRALSLTSASVFNINNTTTTIINTPGYYRIVAGFSMRTRAAGSENLAINITDGVTTKAIWSTIVEGGGADNNYLNDIVDYTIFLEAGDSCTITASSQATIRGSSRQIATVSGELVNP